MFGRSKAKAEQRRRQALYGTAEFDAALATWERNSTVPIVPAPVQSEPALAVAAPPPAPAPAPVAPAQPQPDPDRVVTTPAPDRTALATRLLAAGQAAGYPRLPLASGTGPSIAKPRPYLWLAAGEESWQRFIWWAPSHHMESALTALEAVVLEQAML